MWLWSKNCVSKRWKRFLLFIVLYVYKLSINPYFWSHVKRYYHISHWNILVGFAIVPNFMRIHYTKSIFFLIHENFCGFFLCLNNLIKPICGIFVQYVNHIKYVFLPQIKNKFFYPGIVYHHLVCRIPIYL